MIFYLSCLKLGLTYEDDADEADVKTSPGTEVDPPESRTCVLLQVIIKLFQLELLYSVRSGIFVKSKHIFADTDV